MNDLLGEVKRSDDGAGLGGDDYRPRRRAAQQAAAAQANPAYNGSGGGDLEMGGVGAAASNPDMDRFFASVDAIRADLARIATLQEDIVNMHEASKVLVKSKDVQKSRQDMQEKINVVSQVAHQAKTKMDLLDRQNLEARKIRGQELGSASERMRTSVTAGLRKKLRDEMGAFSELRTRVQDEYRTVVQRRVYTVTGQQIEGEEINRLIETGQAENIFQTALLSDAQGRGKVLDTLAEIEERHKAMKGLEQSLLELHQMFLDMAVLVEVQGEQLDNIAKQVERGAEHVHVGTQALQEAKWWQTKSRKCMCIAAIIIIIIIIIVVIAVVRPWQYTN